MPDAISTPAANPEPGAERRKPDRALVWLWVGVLLAPAGWVADLLIRYALIRTANVNDRLWPLRVTTVMGLTLALAGAAICWRARRQAEPGPRATLASWGLALAAYFLLLILAQAFPSFVIGPREIT